MRIDRLFNLGLPTISFEFFPPKNEAGWAQLYQAIGELHALKPSYVSVTYGAGGSTRAKTLELTSRIQNELKIRSMAHLTCVGHTADEIGRILDDLWAAGIHNVLALRGDPPAGQTTFVATQGGFANADALVHFIRNRQGGQEVCVGVAGYPEGHPQCLNLTRDMEHLQRKADNGADFVVTQLFFDNADFYRFRDRARSMGIKVPIVAGIMPILNVGQIKRFVSMCGSKIPHPLLTRLEALESDPEAVHSAGVDYATAQCKDLLANGCEGIHFYTLNRSKATVQIVKALQPKHAA
ncbi:MAG TPA: methylenetetrahydrofolate reductase [NAD(P)H] [Tepidisphaeraceae bacterium]|jgi:methylenetetrahydrofolate reductase (NADPH)